MSADAPPGTLNTIEARVNRGAALFGAGRYAEALAEFDAALALGCPLAGLHYNRGRALQELGRLEESLGSFTAALRERADYPEALNSRGNVLRDLGRTNEALESYSAAIEHRADYIDALVNRGSAWLALRRPAEALADYDCVLRLRTDHFGALINRSNVWRELGRFEEALADSDSAVRLAPRSASALANRASLLGMDFQRVSAALADFARALDVDPDHADARWNRAHLLLLAGDYAAGWREYECRWQRPPHRDTNLPPRSTGSSSAWRGAEPIAGKTLLLTHEQGLGDTLQFCRYGLLALERGARVILQVPPGVVRLLRSQPWCVEGGCEVVGLGDPLPAFDLHCPLMSLPLAFGTTVETIPYGKEAYLRAVPEDVARWSQRLDEHFAGRAADQAVTISQSARRLRVGLVWNGGFRADQPELWAVNERRNVPLEKFAKALDLPGVDFVSLQKGDPAESELRGREAEFWRSGRLFNAAAELHDFADTAGLIANLDLMISVDTSTAHLAAALGKPTWILNRYDTCWRWLLEREDSPWYGSVKLYRQGSDRDWTPVLERLAEDVLAWQQTWAARASNGLPLESPFPAPPDLQSRLEAAMDLHRSGRLEEALREYSAIIDGHPRHYEALRLAGIAALQSGDIEFAVQHLRAALQVDPRDPDVHYNLGSALIDRGSHLEALGCFDRALEIDVGFAEAHCNRGVALLELGRTGEALTSLDRALDLRQDYATAHFNRGRALQTWGRTAAAIPAYQSAVRARPDYLEAWRALGGLLLEEKRHAEALATFDELLVLAPGDAAALNDRGIACVELGRLEDALAEFTAAVAHRVGFADALANRGNVLQRLERFSEAVEDFEAALRVSPDFVEALIGLGAARRALRQPEQALEALDAAVRIAPDRSEAHGNRGNVLRDLHRFVEAIAEYDQSIALDATLVDPHWNKANVALLTGDYARGWPEYEWRWRLTTSRPLGTRGPAEALWHGKESIEGKRLLVSYEQGLGDSLQFCRYALLALGRGSRVILQVPPGLVRLLRSQPWCVEGGCEVVGLGDPLPAFDLHCPLMSLPLAFGTTVETIPYGKEAYLRAVPEDVARWSQRLDEHFAGRAADQAVTISQSARRLRVGLVWNGGFRADQPELWAVNERRNVPLEKFAKALDLPGVDFVSLQKGDPAESELRGREAEFWKSGRLFNAAAELHDFADTAGLIANLDLMISVDTSTAHLAAALGKPTWILNRYDTCWRWLLEREDSPWYGSVRLYRQGSDRDWTPVLARLRDDLLGVDHGTGMAA